MSWILFENKIEERLEEINVRCEETSEYITYTYVFIYPSNEMKNTFKMIKSDDTNKLNDIVDNKVPTSINIRESEWYSTVDSVELWIYFQIGPFFSRKEIFKV
jgi:hypothetical protein